MANKNIDISLRATDDGVTNVINKTERAIDNLGKEAEEAGKDVENLGKESQETGQKLDDAFRPTSVDTLPEKVDNVTTSVSKLSQHAENLRGKFEKWRNIGAGLAVAGAGALVVSQRVGEIGRDVEETENLIGESFGNSTAEIKAWGDNLQNTLKLNSVEVRKNAAVFNVMFDSMGFAKSEALDMSKSLTLLANDMASFYNLDPAEAFIKLRAGITGEAEPLKALGILIDEQTISTYAYANGIAAAGSQLTQQQKVQARYGAILAQTTKAQGDLERTLDSSANVARAAGNAFEIAQQNIGAGSASAQKHVDNLLAHVLTLANGMPSIQKAAGAAFTWGAYGASAIGTIISVGSQVGLLTMAFPSLAASATTAFATITSGAGVAAAATLRLAMTTLAAVAPYLAVAAAAAAVFYGIDKLFHWKEDKELQENIKRGDATDQKRLEFANKQRAKRGLAPLTMAEYEGDPIAGDDSGGALDAAAGINNAIKKAENAANSAPSIPAIPTPASVPVITSQSASPESASPDQSARAKTNARGVALGQIMAQAGSLFNGGAPYSTINADGSISEYPDNTNARKITLRPKTRVSQNSAGNYVVEILPEKFTIPNDFAAAVGAL